MKSLEPPLGEEVLKKLSHWRHVFSLHDLNLVQSALVKHKIQLTSNKPIKEIPCRVPPSMNEEKCWAFVLSVSHPTSNVVLV